MIAKTLSLLTLFVLLASANGQQQSSPPATKTGTKSSKPTSVVLADTDDTCHLFLDDTDEGTITPVQSRKLSATPGEHIIKCSVEGIPDLLWRKVIEVKVGAQSAVVISLKALHIQYDQAIEQQKKQQEQALEAEEKEKVQAKATEEEQKVQAAAAAEATRRAQEELPHKLLEIVKGNWEWSTSCPMGSLNWTMNQTLHLNFREVDSDGSVLATYGWKQHITPTARGDHDTSGDQDYIFIPKPPDTLESTREARTWWHLQVKIIDRDHIEVRGEHLSAPCPGGGPITMLRP